LKADGDDVSKLLYFEYIGSKVGKQRCYKCSVTQYTTKNKTSQSKKNTLQTAINITRDEGRKELSSSTSDFWGINYVDVEKYHWKQIVLKVLVTLGILKTIMLNLFCIHIKEKVTYLSICSPSQTIG